MNETDSIFLSVREGYDRWAQIYDEDDIPLTLVEEEAVGHELGPVIGLKVLELGCGTGRRTMHLVKNGGNVVAVDQSPEMLKRAKNKIPEGVKFQAHDLDQPLPFEAISFDCVVSFLVLEHISNLGNFFAECARVCRPGGFLYFSVIHPAMLLRGIQARFTDPQSGTKIYPKSFPYQMGDYLNAAARADLRLVSVGEYACNTKHAEISPRALKYLDWPLLLTLKLTP